MAEKGDQLSLRVLAWLALAGAAGCATSPPGPVVPDGDPGAVSPAPAATRSGLGPAGEALFIQGANERRAGDYGAAAATLERALRIEPTAPALWLELARVRLLQGELGLAEQLARKAGSLAAPGSPAAEESRRLLAEALQR